MILKLLLVLAISWLFHYLPVISAKKDRIKLNEIQTLTLYSDRWTESRRTSPIQQLTCIGGYCNQVQIRSAQCYNRGSDGRSIQWECKADISSEYQFGHLDMSCEGYDSSDDDYILAGSCGLRYTIIKRADNDHKQQKHSKNMYGNSNNYNNYGSNYKNLKSQTKKNESFSFIPIIVVALIIFFIYYKCIRKKSKPTDDHQQQQPGVNPMTGAGGGGSNQFPFFATPSAPPPPGFRPDLFQQQQQPSPQPFQPPPSYTKYPSGSNVGGGGGGGGRSALPGMLGGAAAGGLMGYLLGSMTNRTRPMQQESSYFGSNDYGTGDHHQATTITDTFMNSSSFGNDDFGGDGFGGSDDMAEAVGFASTSER